MMLITEHYIQAGLKYILIMEWLASPKRSWASAVLRL